jgi:hypothetical protein
MGHYDSCYEYEDEQDAKRLEKTREERKDSANDKVRSAMYDMNMEQVELLAEIAEDIDAFERVFKVIGRKR